MPTGRTLSNDIYLLGDLLGEVIRTQAGQAAFDLEEEVRALGKAFRAGRADAGDTLAALVAGVGADEASMLIRAFTNYFQLINLCEDNERIRRIRRREAEVHPAPRRGSIARGDRDPRTRRDERRRSPGAAGPGRGAAGPDRPPDRGPAADGDRQAGPRLPHHPRSRRAADCCRRRSIGPARASPRPSPSSGARNEVRAVQPTVLDEVHAGLVHFRSTLVHVVPQIYRDLEESDRRRCYPGEPITVPPFLTFGSWVGGDRDGNPNVTPAVTAEALRVMRTTALELLEERLVELAGRISVSTLVTGPAPGLDALIEAQPGAFPRSGRRSRAAATPTSRTARR